jgi:sigma-B regulation protein RsbU (phosphoserine phosphatase)
MITDRSLFMKLRLNFLVFYSGHNPPLIIRSGQKPQWLKFPEGFPMGVMEDSIFRTERVVLDTGDTLILYTDGVTKAMDYDTSLFAADRLLNAAEKSKDLPLEDLVTDIITSVKNFTGEEPQSDDITILAVRVRGKE